MDADAFARQWCEDWNSHDAERVLAHFSDDVVFTSPVALRILPDTAGVVHGKQGLRDYWTYALTLVPDLHFELIEVYSGIDLIVINYRNQMGGLVNEILRFAGGMVVEGHGTYAPV
jgi:hypothetical protein